MNEQSAKMWSGRFREPLNKQFEDWQRSFPFDFRLIPQEVAASKAHARAIAAANILTADELSTMLSGLDKVAIHFAAEPAAIASAAEPEDVHHFVELELTRIIGPLALK